MASPSCSAAVGSASHGADLLYGSAVRNIAELQNEDKRQENCE